MNKVAVFVALGAKIINSSEKKARNLQSQIVYTTKMHETRVLILGSFFSACSDRNRVLGSFFHNCFQTKKN